MAGTLTIDTLKASSGVLATQNGMAGIAKAWLNYNGSTQTINGSFNVSSVTKVTTGIYTVNFSTAMSNANYSWSGICGNPSSNIGIVTLWTGTAAVQTTTSLPFGTVNASWNTTDFSYVELSVFGA